MYKFDLRVAVLGSQFNLFIYLPISCTFSVDYIVFVIKQDILASHVLGLFIEDLFLAVTT